MMIYNYQILTVAVMSWMNYFEEKILYFKVGYLKGSDNG